MSHHVALRRLLKEVKIYYVYFKLFM